MIIIKLKEKCLMKRKRCRRQRQKKLLKKKRFICREKKKLLFSCETSPNKL